MVLSVSQHLSDMLKAHIPMCIGERLGVKLWDGQRRRLWPAKAVTDALNACKERRGSGELTPKASSESASGNTEDLQLCFHLLQECQELVSGNYSVISSIMKEKPTLYQEQSS